MGRIDSDGGSIDDVWRCAFGSIFCGSETYTGMFFDVSDRIYPGGRRDAGDAGGGKCPGGTWNAAPYGKPFVD